MERSDRAEVANCSNLAFGPTAQRLVPSSFYVAKRWNLIDLRGDKRKEVSYPIETPFGRS